MKIDKPGRYIARNGERIRIIHVGEQVSVGFVKGSVNPRIWGTSTGNDQTTHLKIVSREQGVFPEGQYLTLDGCTAYVVSDGGSDMYPYVGYIKRAECEAVIGSAWNEAGESLSKKPEHRLLKRPYEAITGYPSLRWPQVSKPKEETVKIDKPGNYTTENGRKARVVYVGGTVALGYIEGRVGPVGWDARTGKSTAAFTGGLSLTGMLAEPEAPNDLPNGRYTTKGGETAQILTNLGDAPFHYIGYVVFTDGSRMTASWTKEGKGDRDIDLVVVPQSKKPEKTSILVAFCGYVPVAHAKTLEELAPKVATWMGENKPEQPVIALEVDL